MHWPQLSCLLVYTALLVTQRVQSTAIRCKTDHECPKPLVCRLVCKRTCLSICVRLRPTQQVIFDHSHLQLASYENDSPFSTPSDMFVESNMESTTPIAVSEMQIGSKELLTENSVDQQDIHIEPAQSIPKKFRPEVNRIPSKAATLNDVPRGPPAPPLRRPHLQTRVPPAPLDFSENSVVDFTEPPRARVTIPHGPIPLPNGPPSPSEIIQISVPSVPPQSRRVNRPIPHSATLPPWRKTRLPPVDAPVNRHAFRGHSNSVHQLKPPNIVETPIKKLDCPPPPICEKNCGISIDENGCQSCKCLWLSALCRHDQDCPQNGHGLANAQFCDLGRCECRSGYIHSQFHSGICERDFLEPSPNIRPSNTFQLNGAKNVVATTDAYKPRPRRSELTAQKPNREERLQWPGPCDTDAECAPNLYCINSDCWHLPDKPLRSFQLENSNTIDIRRSQPRKINEQLFPLSGDYEEPPQIKPPSILPDIIETTTKSLKSTSTTNTPSPITTSIDGFVTRPSKNKSVGKQKAVSVPIDSSTEYPLQEFTTHAFKSKSPGLSGVISIPIDSSTDYPLPDFFTRPFKDKSAGKPKVLSVPIDSSTDYPLPEFNVDPLVEPITDEELNKEVFMESTTVSSTTITDDQLNREVNSESTVQTKMPEFTNPTKTTKHRQTTTQIPPSTIDTWKEMTPESATKFTPITTKSPLLRNKMAPVFLDYSNRRNKPVRIEAFNAKDKIKDECQRTEDCGKLVCCAKRYCDLSFNCGNGRFCLPDCRLTKMIHLPGTFQPNATMIDIIYD